MPILNVIVTLGISLIGTVGNLTIIYVFIRYKSLRCVNNIFVMQLSVVDFIKALFLLPLKAATQLSTEIKLSKSVCSLSAFLSSMAFVHAPLVLAAIAFIRYIIVVKPYLYLIVCSRPRITKYSMFILIIASLFSLLPFMGVGQYEFSIYHGVCFTSWSQKNLAFRVILYILTMGTTYPIMILCYGRIFQKLKKHSRSLARSMSSNPSIDVKRRRTDSHRDRESFRSQQDSHPENIISKTLRNGLSFLDEDSVDSSCSSDQTKRTLEEKSTVEMQEKSTEEVRTVESNVFPASLYNVDSEKKRSRQKWAVTLESSPAEALDCLGDRESDCVERVETDVLKPRSLSYTCLRVSNNSDSSNRRYKTVRSWNNICDQGNSRNEVIVKNNAITSDINQTDSKKIKPVDSDTAELDSTFLESDDENKHYSECKHQSSAGTETVALLPIIAQDSPVVTETLETNCSTELLPIRHKMTKMEIKVTKIMFIIVLAYTICWLPAFLVNIIMLSGGEVSDDVLYLIVTLVDMKVLLNPLIYGVGSPMIRSAICASFCRRSI